MSTSLESFVNVIKRSGLVNETVLSESLDSFRELNGDLTGELFAEALIQKDVITSWQAGKLLQGKHKGFFLGKYKLLSLLGKGGMSSVYLAEHVLMRRRCAIKVLPWKLVKDSSYLQRFHREAQAVAALDHPNIIRAYDIDHEKDGNLEIHFLVMEFVEGHNLYDLVQMKGPLSAVTAADYIRQGALGLAHAHSAGMVHRDVKPGNFLVDRHGTVKLMDLGLARVSAQQSDHSLTIAHDERVLGTADYLAPEQAVDSHLVDTRADLYSLGCTMYFLLTGRPPFNEGTLTQRLLAHQTKEPTSIESLRPDVPTSLVEMLHKLMKKDREERYQTAEEVAQEMTRWLKTQSGTDTTPIPPIPESDDSHETLEPASGIDEAETGEHLTRELGAADSTKKEGAEGELGDFLSSLSDVVPSPSSKKTKPSSSKVKPKSDKSSSRVTADSSPRNAPAKGSGRIQARSGRVEAPVLEPASDKLDPNSGIQKPSGTRPPGSSGKLLKSSDSTKSSQPQASTSGIQKPIPAEWVERFKQNKIAVIAGSAFVLLLLASLLLFIPGQSKSLNGEEENTASTTPDDETSDTPQRPPVEGDTVTVGPDGNFGSISEAIEFIRQNAFSSGSNAIQKIQVAGKQTLKETISIDNSGLGTFPRGIRIIGPDKDSPRLISPDDSPVIALNSVDGLAFENLVIECGESTEAVQLQGYMAGAQFTNLQFEKVQKTAIGGRGLGGLPDQPIIIRNCTFHASAESATGVQLDATSGLDSRDIKIQRCRFLGPMAVGVTIQNSSDSIEFRQNIFEAATTGVLLSGEDAVRKQLTFVNNTFHKCERGIVFESGPSTKDAKFTFQQNLFVDGSGPSVAAERAEVTPEQLAKGAKPAKFNWTDREKVAVGSELDIFTNHGKVGSKVDFVSEDPANAQFLKPATQELKKAAAGTSEPLKFIGAVSP